MEQGLTKQRIITELTRSPHGDLKEYLPIVKTAALEDPFFLAHLIAWNTINGQVRDAKVALPVCYLKASHLQALRPPECIENALAHLALLDPRNLVRALCFAAEVKTPGQGRALDRLVARYLRAREDNFAWWLGAVMQHRTSLKTLYARYHIKPSPLCDKVLFKGYRPSGSNLEAVAQLGSLSPADAASAVIKHRIPFLVAVNVMGKDKAKSEDFVMALIMQMSPAELVNNTKLLERLGLKDSPVLRAAYVEGLRKVMTAKGTQAATLKTTRAAEQVTDKKLKAQLANVQEKQIAQLAVKGNWLVIGDKSSSMQRAIEAAKLVAATLAKFVEGEVYLVFCDTSPQFINVTGKGYEELLQATKHVRANGATSLGCGVQYALERKWDLNGIAVVSDGAENTAPAFTAAYDKLCAQSGTDVPVYLYWMQCAEPNQYNNNPDALAQNMARGGHDVQVFDVRQHEVDMYSLPNMVLTMRASRYALLDDIMATPLLTLDEVFKQKEEKEDAA